MVPFCAHFLVLRIVTYVLQVFFFLNLLRQPLLPSGPPFLLVGQYLGISKSSSRTEVIICCKALKVLDSWAHLCLSDPK